MNKCFKVLDYYTCLGYIALASSNMVIPICLPDISITLSTSLTEGGGSEAVKTLFAIIIILLCGFLSNRFGKKLFLVSGYYLIALGSLLASNSSNYISLLISIMIMGVGSGSAIALINPLVIDLHPNNSVKFLNITNAFYPIGIMLSAILFGELLTIGISWQSIFKIVSLITFTLGISLNIKKFPPIAGHYRISLSLIKNIFLLKKIWLYIFIIFLAACIESVFTFWSRSFIDVYYDSFPRIGAISLVIFSSAMALGRLVAANLYQTISIDKLMFISAILGIVVTLILPVTSNIIIFFILLFMSGISISIFWPTILSIANDDFDTDKTILTILLTCFGVIGMGVSPLITGYLGDITELKFSFFLVPFYFFLITMFCVKKYTKK